jgi:hypothetical protein
MSFRNWEGEVLKNPCPHHEQGRKGICLKGSNCPAEASGSKLGAALQQSKELLFV